MQHVSPFPFGMHCGLIVYAPQHVWSAVQSTPYDVDADGQLYPSATAASAATQGWHTATRCAPGPRCSRKRITWSM